MVVEKLTGVAPGVYSVAWFKLAEFVTRKEKERAFGVYRLLSHSIADRAFAAQLEADLFMAFQDERAAEMYQKAALLYEQQNQLTHAALVYEQLMVLQPNNKEHVERAFKLYSALRNDMKVIRCARQLLTLLIKQSALRAVDDFFITLSENKLNIHHDLYEACVHALGKFHPERTDLMYTYLDPLLQSLTRNTDNPQRLSLFLARLSHSQPKLHQYACERLDLPAERTAA